MHVNGNNWEKEGARRKGIEKRRKVEIQKGREGEGERERMKEEEKGSGRRRKEVGEGGEG